MGQPGNTLTYQDRKERGICTYPGCRRNATDVSSMCRWHHRRARKRARLSAERIRADRERKARCIYCGKPARPKRKTCHACVVRLGSPPKSLVDKRVDKLGRIASRTEVDKDGRTRYRGQPRRGRRTVITEINEGLADCDKLLRKAREGVAYADSDEVKQLPRIQRDEVRKAALWHLHLLWRTAGETLKLGGYELEVEQIDDDEDDDEEIGAVAAAAGR